MNTATDAHKTKGERDDRPVDTRPYLCIPYWNFAFFPGQQLDDGEQRPLPASVISWECVSIHASPYTPGGQLDVSVDVRNSGGGNAAAVATLIVYWADPTVGFAKPTFFGATSVSVQPRGGFATTPTMSAVIPAGAPDHICLLAVVYHSLDPPGTSPNPVGDRHWAQRNLQTVTVSPAGPSLIPFQVGNPFSSEVLLELQIRVLDGRALETVALRMKAEPSPNRPRLHLLDDLAQKATDEAREPTLRVPVALGPRAARQFHLQVGIDENLGSHELIAIEAAVYVDHHGQQAPAGSLGIVLRGDDASV